MSSPATYTFRQLEPPPDADAHSLEAARREADGIRAAARAQGEAEGRAAGEAAARAAAAEMLAQLGQARQALDQLRDAHLQALERDAARLAVRLAEQIVAGALDVEPQRLTDIAELALRRLTERRSVTLVVNPESLELMSAAVEALRSQLGGIDQLSVQADRRVARGGVVARTEDGEIDATVEAQLQRAREIIAEELGGPVAPSGDDGGAPAEDSDPEP